MLNKMASVSEGSPVLMNCRLVDLNDVDSPLGVDAEALQAFEESAPWWEGYKGPVYI